MSVDFLVFVLNTTAIIHSYRMIAHWEEHGMSESGLQALVEDAAALRKLIGRRVSYMGQAYEIVDLLIEDDLLILSGDEGTDVQEDSYGRASRLVPHQHNLRFRDVDGHATHVWTELAFLDGPLNL